MHNLTKKENNYTCTTCNLWFGTIAAALQHVEDQQPKTEVLNGVTRTTTRTGSVPLPKPAA